MKEYSHLELPYVIAADVAGENAGCWQCGKIRKVKPFHTVYVPPPTYRLDLEDE